MSLERRIARRRLLQGVGCSMAIPWLPSLAGERPPSRGGPASPCFVAVFSPNGQQRASYWPDGEPDWRVLDPGADVREVRLSELPGPGLSRVLGPELDPLREKLLLIRGLDLVPENAYGHYPTAMLSGYSRFGQYYPTIDQVLAGSAAFYPHFPAMRSVHAVIPGPGVVGDPMPVALAGGSASLVRGILDARRMFELAFENDLPSRLDSPEQRIRRGLVLDRVRGQFHQLMGSSRIGAEDRQRLDAHVTFLHELQSRLALAPLDTTACQPDLPPELLLHEEVNLPRIVDDHIDVLVAIIRCGLTRVATLQLGHSTEGRTFPFVPEGPFYLGHHVMTHELSTVYEPELSYLNRWYAQKVARLLTLLDDVADPETGETWLDRSVVYWGNEFGCNAVHKSNAMPVLLAGSAGGRLQTGRYLDYRRRGLRFDFDGGEADTLFADDGGTFDWRGRPYNELLISLLHAMGLGPADYESDGEPGFGDYTNNRSGMYRLGDRRSPLPHLGL